uniref:Uncharacterized protein n=1 Tax=Arundo donax TaxID=35708 RepID=A0A0A9BZD3_ARUDO
MPFLFAVMLFWLIHLFV